LHWNGGNKEWKEVTADVIRTLHRALPDSLQHSLDMLKSNDTLLNILGPDLSTVYKAVKESMLKLESSIDEEVMDDFNKA
jgi:glutamine synthetase